MFVKEVYNSRTASADIDAIGAINSVIKLSINTDVLFDVRQFILKESADQILDSLAKIIQQVNRTTILVEGHTDNDGDSSYNLTLSKKRSKSVVKNLKYLFNSETLYDFELKFYGENKPKVKNNTPNKQLNRRVEITVLPSKKYYKSLLKKTEI